MLAGEKNKQGASASPTMHLPTPATMHSRTVGADFFAVIESVLVQPSTCSPECYHGLHTVHCSIMCCNEVQCSAVQCSAVELLIYIGGAPADSLVRGRGKGSLGQHTLRQF